MLNNNGPNMKPCGAPLNLRQNYCKKHSPLFLVSFFQGKMLKGMENLYLFHNI